MIGTGTLINVAAIVIGGGIGLLGGKWLNDRTQETLIRGMAVCVLFVAIAGVLEEIQKHDLPLLGVLPQDELVYQYDCDGKPSSQVPATAPIKVALHEIMRKLNL